MLEKKLNNEKTTCRFKDIWKGKKILVADDESTSIFLIKEILKKTKIEIINAIDGQQALNACISNSDLSLALIDYNMPILDGEKTTEKIKAIRKDMPVIIQTGYYEYSIRTRCQNAGCSDIIYKPLRPLELLEKIERWINMT